MIDIQVNPCYSCHERQLGCHASCDRYKAWRADLDSYNAHVRRVRHTKQMLDDDMFKKPRRRSRR